MGILLAAQGEQARSQQVPAAQEPPQPRVITANQQAMSLDSINADYNRQLLVLERQRLDRLARLASQAAPQDAMAIYEQYFRLAITNNLFREAEPIADQIVRAQGGSPTVRLLAHTVDIVAAADRGAFEESLASLRTAIDQAKQGDGPGSRLDSSSMLAVLEAYFQRLVQADQLGIARSAFETLAKEAKNPAVKAYCESRLKELNLVGSAAPGFKLVDLDGKAVDLAAMKGKVVLLDFWASWCEPSAQELAWLDEVYNRYHASGLEIVGVSMDLSSEGATKESVMPVIRRFVLDHNVRWPILVNAAGPDDLAKLYGVGEVPANILIDRDGKVIHLDLTRRNLISVIGKACTR